MEDKRKPVHKIRYGAIDGAIWVTNSLSGCFYDTTFSKTYRWGDAWRHTQSYGDRDLLDLAKAATEAHTWIQDRKNAATVVTGEN